MPDNKRYVGDVFIDGKTDKLLQEFLTNLFEQYNGEGKGFNADMLDGHHYNEIEEELIRLDSEKLSSITIGDTIFNSNQSSNFLHFSDVLYDDFTSLPWREEIPLNYDINATLLDLYTSVIQTMNETLDTKVDKEKVNPDDTTESPRMKVLSDNNFTDEEKQRLSTLSNAVMNSVESYTDENNEEHLVLDSQLSNGLRFILITPEQYNAYKNSSIEAEREFVHSWRNIFIFKDAADMPSPAEYASPLTLNLRDGYTFRLANDDSPIDSTLNSIDSNNPNPVWLQIKHNWSNDWTNIAPLQDFLYGAKFDDTIVNVVETNEQIRFNPTALKVVLNDILNDSSNEDYLPINYILTSDKNQFVHNLVKDDNILPTIETDDGYSNVDITQAFDTEFTNIDNRISAITNPNQTGTLDAQISGLKSTIDNLNNQINGAQADAIIKQLSSINSSINNIKNDVASIRNTTNSYGKWESARVGGLTYSSGGTTYYSTCYYNRALGVGVFYFSFNHYNLAGDNGWGYRQISARSTDYNEVKAKPSSNVVFSCTDSPTSFVRLDADGGVQVKCSASKDGNRHMLGQGVYKIGGYN